MTRRKAEEITGYQIRPVAPRDEHNKFHFGAYDEKNQLLITADNHTEEIALATLVEAVYKMHSNEVLQNHGYRCAFCGSPGRLETDHIVPRSKGRDDRKSNLRPLCPSCHRRRHIARRIVDRDKKGN